MSNTTGPKVAVAILSHAKELYLSNGVPWADPMTRQGLAAAIATEGQSPQVMDLRVPGQIEALMTYLKGCNQVIVHDLPTTAMAITKAPDELRAVPWWDIRLVERAIHLGAMAKWPDDPGRQDTVTALLGAYHVGARMRGLAEVLNPDLARELAQGGSIPPSTADHLIGMAEGLDRIAAAQRQAASPELLNHLVAVEMPAAVKHVAMTLNGVLLNSKLCQRLNSSIPDLLQSLAQQLATPGPAEGEDTYKPLTHPERTDAIAPWLIKNGMRDALHQNRNGTYEVDDDTLKFLESKWKPAEWLRQFRKLEDLQGQPWLRGAMTSADGRVHPLHLAMHAATGRSATVDPGIAGIPKWCRPLVWALPGHGVVELDYVGCEILAAACYHHEPWLQEVYRSGDAVSYLAKALFPVETEGMSLVDVANTKNGEALRNTSKSVIYGIFYGRLAKSLAKGLRIPPREAEQLVNTIRDRCPNMTRRMKAAVNHAGLTGEIKIGYGLVRRLRKEEWDEAWKVRTLGMNSPIQGIAGIVFRIAMPMVAQAIKPYGGRIILPNHDAFLLEGPLGDSYQRTAKIIGYRNLEAISEAGRQAMIAAALTVFPELQALVDVADASPGCWNKKGKHTSVQDFIAACVTLPG